jgi:DmsE family decaheme c-type cytochrome
MKRSFWKAAASGVVLAISLTSIAYAADSADSQSAKHNQTLSQQMSGMRLAADTSAAPASAPQAQGDAQCTSCHDASSSPATLAIGKTRHGTTADGRTPSCTDCHGASEKHMNGNGTPDRMFGRGSSLSAAERDEVCLACHQDAKRIGWQSSKHANRDVTCTSCHQVHARDDTVRDKVAQTEVCYSCHKEQRAQMSRPTHHPVPEGKMNCTSCHDVHGDNPKGLIKSSTNDTCYTCHMDKRGPFVHNHEPVQEDCGICHQPHGTTIASLLKQRSPMLCNQCHTAMGGTPFLPHAGSSPGTAGIIGTGCMNCHQLIHGSNSTQNAGQPAHFRR